MANTTKKQAKRKAAKPKKKQAQQAKVTFEARVARTQPVTGLCFVLLTMLLGISLLDYNTNQSPIHTTDASNNLVGMLGANIAAYGLRWLGAAVFALPVYSFWLAYMAFFKHFRKMSYLKWLVLLLAITSCAVLAAMSEMVFSGFSTQYFTNGLGGIIGSGIFNSMLKETVGPIGSSLIMATAFLVANGFLLRDNIASSSNMRGLFEAWQEARSSARENSLRRREEKAEREARQAELEEAERKKKIVDAPPPLGAEPIPGKGTKQKQAEEAKKTPVKLELPEGIKPDEADLVEPADNVALDISPIEAGGEPIEPARSTKPKEAAEASKPAAAKRKPAPPSEKGTMANVSELTSPEAPPSQRSTTGGLKIVASESTRKATQPHIPERKGKYVFPPMRLLQEPAEETGVPTAGDHEATAAALVQTLSEFGVKVELGEVHAGPVITRYDIYPAPGVRVEKIANLDKNIALSLKAMSVRILAPVPGKGCVGIEVPNKKPLSVCIRDILESEDWANYKAEIPIALGKEVSGRPLMADLTRMPHLLIAGSTGSGKTVCINSVIASLLYHSSPEDLRFVMVDPKIVEMQVYNDLPHMLIPVVTDPKKVPGALKYLLREMERRYQLFATKGVRNIAGYNAKMAKIRDEEAETKAAEMDASLSPEERAALSSIEVPRQLGLEDEEAPDKLPYIICIVDELADLMMVAPADIETGIARLAQLARAAGIHLILATQRPSVNVITGVIKANLPSRISFKVASKVDSRTILDGQGAEGLIGRGDMLFLPPGSADLTRSQGAFVSDEEINGIVDFIKENNDPPSFDEQFQRTVEEGDEEGGDSDNPFAGDEQDADLMKKALEVIKTSKRASTSHLQRRLSIGYNRAARVMDKLEDAGIVGPDNGSSPREILVDVDEL